MQFQKLFILLITSLASLSSFADPATVEIYNNIGSASLSFKGDAAAAFYDELRVAPTEISPGLYQKVGENISCTSAKRSNGVKSTCGLILMTESGTAEPELIMFPQPGTSIGN